MQQLTIYMIKDGGSEVVDLRPVVYNEKYRG